MPKLVRRGTGQEHELADGTVRIGRSSKNDVQVIDRHVSRAHCRIEGPAGGWVLTDDSSTIGTFVNGRRVRQHRLQHGDEIKVSSARFTFDETPVRPSAETQVGSAATAPSEASPEGPSDEPAKEQAEANGERSRGRRLLGLLPVVLGTVVAVGVIGGLIALVVSTRQTPRRVVRQAADRLGRRDAEALWRLVTDDRKQQITLDEFKDQVKLLPDKVLRAARDLEIGVERRVELGVVVPVALQVDGVRVADEVVLYREDGNWRIHSVPVHRIRELVPEG